jgi:yeast amino acid transporter
VGGSPDAEVFFENYLAFPILIAFYVFWKIWSRKWALFVQTKDMDVTTGVRRGSIEMAQEMRAGPVKSFLRAFF